jgi:hypothetical protein
MLGTLRIAGQQGHRMFNRSRWRNALCNARPWHATITWQFTSIYKVNAVSGPKWGSRPA